MQQQTCRTCAGTVLQLASVTMHAVCHLHMLFVIMHKLFVIMPMLFVIMHMLSSFPSAAVHGCVHSLTAPSSEDTTGTSHHTNPHNSQCNRTQNCLAILPLLEHAIMWVRVKGDACAPVRAMSTENRLSSVSCSRV